MLNILGIKLPPVLGIALGVALIALGLWIQRPMLCLVGIVMIVATAVRGRSAPPGTDERR
jgi:hypothetical protein